MRRMVMRRCDERPLPLRFSRGAVAFAEGAGEGFAFAGTLIASTHDNSFGERSADGGRVREASDST